jgi:hypothetical protein
MQAVFLRQFAREAESLAHQSTDPERQASSRRYAEQWRALAEELDAANEAYDFDRTWLRPAEASASA